MTTSNYTSKNRVKKTTEDNKTNFYKVELYSVKVKDKVRDG